MRLVGASRRRRLATAVVLLALVVFGWTGWRAYTAYRAYHDALADVRAIQNYSRGDLTGMSTADFAELDAHFADLRACVAQLDRATHLPLGGAVVERLPWIGPRYRADRDFLSLADLLSDAGQTGADVAGATLTAFEATGPSADGDPSSPTWLDVLVARQDDIQRAADEIATAKALRAGIDERLLPGKVRGKLPELDRALNALDYEKLADEELPVLRAALGGDGTARYLVLFQNPAELRPSGGFPGTMGLFTIEHGQLRDYRIFDAHTLSDAYISQHLTQYPQPWAIQQYFPSPALVLHDASWWADFPRSGAQTLEMYQQTDWPPIDGVIAVQPGVISDLLRVTGSLTVDIDGEQRLITPENVYDEIERQRRLHREGLRPTEEHKEALALIGAQILDRLKQAKREDLRLVAEALKAEADHRDIQLYASNAAVQGWLDDRHWTGRIVPDPQTPTFAVTLANVNTNKSGLRMFPSATLDFGPAVNGKRTVTMQLYLHNTGTNEEDPFYAGFQKWWVEVTLPEGSRLTGSYPDSMPDPESPSGGSYLIEIFPQQVGYLSVTFTMPDASSLLLRRQPGVNPLDLRVHVAGCQQSEALILREDTVLQPGRCP